MNAPITLQWRTERGPQWYTARLLRIPTQVNVKIRIDCSAAGATSSPLTLIERIKTIGAELGGEIVEEAAPGGDLIEPGEEENLVEILVSDGTTPCPLEARIAKALENGRSRRELAGHTWVLPLMPAGGSPSVLPPEVRKQNIAFWKQSIDDLALTALARAGVTSLDRRVFISYRRVDSEPMANQIRQALEDLNFDVFLDTVSVDPGINFQSRLFEQLADKSMILLIHSETFSRSEWTMAEVEYAKDHDLSVLIVRLPTVPPGDRLDTYYRAGDVDYLEPADVVASNGKPPYSLTPAALARLLPEIIEQHDVEMVARLALLRRRILEGLRENAVVFRESDRGVSFTANSSDGTKTYRLFPGSRPPGLPELYGASICDPDVSDRRIVIGHVSSFDPDRILQMDWTVGGRNVSYADVSMIDTLAKQIKGGIL